KIAMLLGLLMITLQGGCQEDKTFKEVVTFEKGFRFSSTGQIQTIPFTGTSTNVTWESITGKPLTFPPSAHTHSYAEITSVPTVDLQAALNDMGIYFGKTTAEINAIIPKNGFGIAYDITLNVYKVYKNGIWSTVITGL
ncbi:MAG TPA: hypothetical protein P5510_04280, partial [Clostridia bacterium]|nr:hypothetical protein [Clostridia bacterium]